VQVSSTGPGPDQPHLLALLRAIRLRLAEPDAAAAGAADTDAALGGAFRIPGTAAPANREPIIHPDRPSAFGTPPEIEPTRPGRPGPPPGAVEPRSGANEPPPGAVEPGSGAMKPPSNAIELRPGAVERPPGGIRPAGLAGSAAGIGAAPGGPVTSPITPATDPTRPPPVRPPGQAPGAGAVVPADGMDPADEAALRELRRLLIGSLDSAGGAGAVAARLRAALVQAEPDLLTALPGSPASQTDQISDALIWLTDHADQPPALAAGCRGLGAALAECGVLPPRLHLVGAALAEAMRAGVGTGAWRQDVAEAWRTTWQHAYDWITHGAAGAAYEPTVWAATVIAHERRRSDLAVVRLRPFLPMPYRPGQYARIEVADLPGIWRPYSLAGAPHRDTIVELHVRAKTGSGVSGTLVYRTTVGDRVRIGRAEGAMVLTEPLRDLLLIAGDTGVAPFKAVLAEMAATGDPRSAVLFWGVRTLDELYDIEEISEIARAGRRITVVPVISEGEAGPYASGLVTDAVAAYGEWSGHDVYLAGPPVMLAATKAALQQLGVDPARIHHDATE
jgi:NAD(P)H-flavin reductase/hemoglobin-like flavoprotein